MCLAIDAVTYLWSGECSSIASYRVMFAVNEMESKFVVVATKFDYQLWIGLWQSTFQRRVKKHTTMESAIEINEKLHNTPKQLNDPS